MDKPKEGKPKENRPERGDKGQKLLFVCTGNTCRSPMAEALAKEILGSDIEVNSAGIGAREGETASPQALEVMKERGLDLSHHRARRLSRSMVMDADFIIPMTRSQELFLKETYPEFVEKIRRLSAYAGSETDVSDPWGGSVEEYRACALQMSQYLEQVKQVLKGG